MTIPDNLIYKDSRIQVSLDQGSQYNRTAKALVISGTRNGFLSLANSLLFAVNELEEVIAVGELPFVSADVDFRIHINDSTEKLAKQYPHPPVTCSSTKSYVWDLGEGVFFDLVAGIHSLGYCNNEIHFDRGMPMDKISVYCVVSV